MVLTGACVKILRKVGETGKLKEEDPLLRVMELSGILRFEPPSLYSLTYTGRSILSLLSSLEEKGLVDVIGMPDDFRFVGSETIAMIESSIKGGGKVSPDFSSYLEERGFSKDGFLTPEAEELWDIYCLAHPQINVSAELARFIKDLPPGPCRLPGGVSRKDVLLMELEAQRLIAFSMPPGDIFNFTGLGQKVKEFIEKGAQPFPVVLSVDIMVAMKKAVEDPGELTENEAEMLQAMSCIDSYFRVLPAGEALYGAYRIYTEGPLVLTPSICLSDEEIDVMFAIGEFSSKEGVAGVTFDRLKEFLEEKMPSISSGVKRFLYSLECFGLLSSKVDESGSLSYSLSPLGKKVMEDQKKRRRAISSSAVKCITITRKEFSAPALDWCEEAKEQGLLGSYGPTDSGILYADLAASVHRTLHLTDFEVEMLRLVSEKEPLYLKEYQEKYGEKKKGKVKETLELLDAKGLLEILPTGMVVLTDAGSLVKRAISEVASGFENPVTPHLIRIVDAIAEVGKVWEKEKKIRVRPDRWREVERLSGLDPETFSETMALARSVGFLGKNTLRDAGYYLFLAMEKLRKDYQESRRWFYR